MLSTTGLGASAAFADTPDSTLITASQFRATLSGDDLVTWDALSANDKATALNYLNDRDVLCADPAATGPKVATVETATVVDPPPTTTAKNMRVPSGPARNDYHAWYYKKYKIFGITYAKAQLDYYFRASSSSVVSDARCTLSLTNRVPARSYDYQTDHWVPGGRGNCTATITVTRAGFWSDTGDMGLQVGGAGKILSIYGP